MSWKQFTHFFDVFVAKTIYALRPDFLGLCDGDGDGGDGDLVSEFFATVCATSPGQAPPS